MYDGGYVSRTSFLVADLSEYPTPYMTATVAPMEAYPTTTSLLGHLLPLYLRRITPHPFR